MAMMCWICCMCWVVMHWVVMVGWIMMGWIVLSRIKMGWRSNRVIWMSPTLLSSITIMPVIVSHNFSSFRFRYRLCYKSINSLRKCLYASQIAPLHTYKQKNNHHSNYFSYVQSNTYKLSRFISFFKFVIKHNGCIFVFLKLEMKEFDTTTSNITYVFILTSLCEKHLTDKQIRLTKLSI
ncbi:hypothetical protein ABH968_001411 [Lysinibacillus sp. RC79]